MNETTRRQRNAKKLGELYPAFRARIAALIVDLEGRGFRPRIQEAWRSPADQLSAFESGHSKLKYGFHNVTGAGGTMESLAVDLLDDSKPLNPSPAYLLQLAAAAGGRRLVTGVRWGLPPALAAAIDDAIKAKEWTRAMKIGWDPTHVQPAEVTVQEARAGKRPR